MTLFTYTRYFILKICYILIKFACIHTYACIYKVSIHAHIHIMYEHSPLAILTKMKPIKIMHKFMCV